MSTTDPSRADLLALFESPPAEYGDFATWFWETGTLTRERITWQLERMKAAGVSGTWYYPRYVGTEPLATDPPYWSDEWREIFNHSVSRASPARHEGGILRLDRPRLLAGSAA